MFVKGFKYGMLIQLAIGPVSLLVFKTAGEAGFGMGLVLVFAVALVDALFITMAGAGAVYFLKKEKIQAAFKVISCVVLVIFGVITILGAFDISVMPGIGLFSEMNTGNIFLQGVLLTASNPLTILFWNSLIAAQSRRQTMNTRHLFIFGTGCVLSTVVFLTAVAAAGSTVNKFLPETLTRVLNVLIGLVLIAYGAVLLVQKSKKKLADCPK